MEALIKFEITSFFVLLLFTAYIKTTGAWFVEWVDKKRKALHINKKPACDIGKLFL